MPCRRLIDARLRPDHRAAELACGHEVEPDAGEMAERYGADTAVLEWRGRLVCSGCGGCNIDMVVTGSERR